MPSRIKIDLDDGNGNKIAISFIGKITRDKVIKILDFVELINGTYINKIGKESNEELSKFDKIQEIVKRKFPIGWFTSQEIMISYEDTFEEPIGLSTVSTYLSRLVEKGILNKSGSVVERKYKLERNNLEEKMV